MKKRVLSLLLVLLMVVSLAPMSALADKSNTDVAYAVEGGNIYFDKAKGTITDCDESVTKASIPSEIEGVAVTKIGGFAFEGCKKIESVTIPNGVTSVGVYAFYRCGSLMNVTMPGSVTSIGAGAFEYCANLTKMIIPDGVTSIGRGIFDGCISLKSIEVPNSVTSIEEEAFLNCSSLTSVLIPDGVTNICKGAFYGCTSLASINIPDSVTKIGQCAFAACDSLTSITISDTLTSIEAGMLFMCSNLDAIEIPNSVTSIGDSAFYGCTSLASINIPNSVTNIGSNVFNDCDGLENVDVENDNPKYMSLSGVLFTKDMSTLMKCPSRKSGTYRIPEGVVSIDDGAFQSCMNLTDIYIPNSVKNIGSGSFQGCESLQRMEIPDGVTNIGDGAFNICSSLTEIIIPKTVTSIGEGAFLSCVGLKQIDVEEGNQQYTSVAGVLFDKEKTVLIQYPTSKPEVSYAIPNGITKIEYYAFFYCENLDSISIPSSVLYIDEGAFLDCKNIKDIYYSGIEVQWENICIEKHNESITNANIHYNHTHDYKAVVTAPTCTERGYTTYTCSVCGDSYKGSYVDPLGHDYKNGTCTRCGAKDPNYKPQANFSDVAAGSYCYDAVQWAVANGITNGTDATHFSPNAGCTRGQVVTFLWRAAGEPTVGGNVGFVDVAPGSYCYEAVKWAVANGITKGTDATHFSPNATCTRGQVVTFMYRAEGEPAVGGNVGFVDVAAGSYCYEAVKWAVANGITNGTDATHFSPSATCTRGQVVTFLYRAE